MRSLSVKLCGLMAGFAVLSLTPVAHAQAPSLVSLPPSGDTYITSMTSAYGTTAGTQSDSGSVTSAVYKTTSGTYDFLYQFAVTTETSPVALFSVSDFTGDTAAFGQSTTFSASYPDTTSSFSEGGQSATNVVFASGTAYFTFTGVGTGQDSDVLLISTNATSFNVNNSALISAVGSNATVLAANGTTAAPEPGALVLAIPGLFGVVGMIRRRHNA